MMPMEPAKLVRIVRPFLVIRLLREREKAVAKDMEGFFSLFPAVTAGLWAAASKGLLSLTTFPSSRRMVRVA